MNAIAVDHWGKILKRSYCHYFVAIALLIANFACLAEPEISAVRTLDSWSLTDIEQNKLDFAPGAGADYRVILFWASWCPYCKALMPHLERFRQAHKDGSIEFYALNIWEDGDAKAYVEKTAFKFRLFLNADKVAEQYGVKGTPGLFMVNKQNEVLYERRSGTAPEQVITDLDFILANQAR